MAPYKTPGRLTYLSITRWVIIRAQFACDHNMFSPAELKVIAKSIERSETRLELQRVMIFGIGLDLALASELILTMETRLADLHATRRLLLEAAMLEPFVD